MLTSRREPDAEAQRTIDEITERYRCRIHTFAADVGDESDSRELLERIRAELPPLAGVAHLAGVLDDALTHNRAWSGFGRRWRPKLSAPIYLDRLTRDDELEFFIVYSSASSVIGSPGQANYSTANALLDGLVADRKAHGLPATGINSVLGVGAVWPRRRPPAPISVRRACFRWIRRVRWVRSPKWSPTALDRLPS